MTIVTVIVAFVVMLVVVAAMALGVIMGRRPIQGSCGGLGRLGISGECQICGGNPDRCDAESARGRKKQTQALSYRASDS